MFKQPDKEEDLNKLKELVRQFVTDIGIYKEELPSDEVVRNYGNYKIVLQYSGTCTPKRFTQLDITERVPGYVGPGRMVSCTRQIANFRVVEETNQVDFLTYYTALELIEILKGYLGMYEKLLVPIKEMVNTLSKAQAIPDDMTDWISILELGRWRLDVDRLQKRGYHISIIDTHMQELVLKIRISEQWELIGKPDAHYHAEQPGFFKEITHHLQTKNYIVAQQNLGLRG